MSNDLKQIPSPHDKGCTNQGLESPGVKERAIILERPNSRLVGSVFVDEAGALSETLVETIRHRSFLLTSNFLLQPQFGVQELVKLRGQVGLIRTERLPSSPDPKRPRLDELVQPLYHRFVVEPVTARHNIRNQTLRNMSDELLDGFYESASMQMVSASMTGEIALVFPDGGPAPSARVEVRKAGASGLEEIIWSLVDLTKGKRFGSTENLHELTKSAYSFNKAENHTIMPGQKIGIVVYRYRDIKRKDAMFVGTDEEWVQKRQELFGDKGKPCVYTGEILRVSEDGKTFEHNINTFKDCSGAIIFLLDKNQPVNLATEATQDGSLFGAAIGVHVGAPPDIITGANVNIGFAL